MVTYPQYPMFQQPMPVYQTMPPQQPIQTQVSNSGSGIVHVQSEEEMKIYPVAPGNTIIFKNDNAPYIYTKSMDSSQLGQPIFEKFRLVKEDEAQEEVVKQPDIKDDIVSLKSDIEFIKKKLTEMSKVKCDCTKKAGDDK